MFGPYPDDPNHLWTCSAERSSASNAPCPICELPQPEATLIDHTPSANTRLEAIAMPLIDSYDVILCETSSGYVFDPERRNDLPKFSVYCK